MIKSIRANRPGMGPVPLQEPQPYNQCDPEVIPEAEDGGGARRDRRTPSLVHPLHKEAWNRMKGWYKAAVDRAPPPTCINLGRITAERVVLNSKVLPSVENIPISMEQFQVEELVPTEDTIE